MPARSTLALYQNEIVIARKDLEINGDDLLALGLEGKEIKRCLDACYQRVLSCPKNHCKAYLIGYVKRNLINPEFAVYR